MKKTMSLALIAMVLVSPTLVLDVHLTNAVSVSTLAGITTSFAGGDTAVTTTETPHEPIYIHGNDNFTFANGVTSGSGTAEDPYVIENWAINASNGRGVWVENTAHYFTLRNILVENGDIDYEGVYFYNVRNGTIENVHSFGNLAGVFLSNSAGNVIRNGAYEKNNNLDGIYLYQSDNNLIENNLCRNNGDDEINLYYSDNNILVNNVAEYNADGMALWLDSSNNNVVEGNIIQNNSSWAVLLEDSNGNALVNNIVENNYVDGFSLWNSNNNFIVNNAALNNDTGIGLYSSEYNTVENNVVKSNYYGISLPEGSYNTISNNTVENNSFGILIQNFSGNNTISNNTVENNISGIFLLRSNNNTISNNTIKNNTDNGIDLADSDSNIISNNIVENNHDYGIYIDYLSWASGSDNNTLENNIVSNNSYGIYLNNSNNNVIFRNHFLNNLNNTYDSDTNYWDNGSAGNWWSDWQPPEHPDANDDGIVDEPRPISGGCKDNFPLVLFKWGAETAGAITSWSAIERWSGAWDKTENVPASWKGIERWRGTASATSSWRTVESWNGHIATRVSSYFEDFDDAAGMTSINGSWSYSSGTYTLCGEPQMAGVSYSTEIPQTTCESVSVKFKLTSRKQWQYAGVLSRYDAITDSGMLGFVDQNSLDGYLAVCIAEYIGDNADHYGNYIEANVSKISFGVWHELKLAASGSLYTLYVDGTSVLTFNSSRFSSGRAGVWAFRGDPTYFDNLAVFSSTLSTPTATTLSISPSSFALDSGDGTTLTATLKSCGAALSNKSITWSVATGTLSASSAMTNASGQATVTYTAPTIVAQTTVTITASFAGDIQYLAGGGSSSGTVSPAGTTVRVWSAVEGWSETISTKKKAWKHIESWSGALKSWDKTENAPASWKSIERLGGTVRTATSAWRAVESRMGTAKTVAKAWQSVERWSATATIGVQWRAAEKWVGTVTAVFGWRSVEIWSGAATAGAHWMPMETWGGTANAPVVTNWDKIEGWSGTVSAVAPAWRIIESWTVTASAPSSWVAVESWSGTACAPTPTKNTLHVQATVDLKPETLQIGSDGVWITCYIELPSDNVANIDVSSIRLENTIPADGPSPAEIGDYDSDGAPDLMVKFSRTSVEAMVHPGHMVLTVSGRVGESSFVGSDTINVINPPEAMVPAGYTAPIITAQTSTIPMDFFSDNRCSLPVIISRENMCSSSITSRENMLLSEVSSAVENLKARMEQMQISVPTSAEMAGNLRDAISAGNVGASISITVEAGETKVEKEFQRELTITAKKVEFGNKIEMEVSSTSEHGKTVMINVDNIVFPNLDEAVKQGRAAVLFDNQVVKQADDYADILDTTNDNGAEYLVLLGANGAQVLVSIPHFSDHTVTVASVPTAAIVPAAAPSSLDSDSKNITPPQSTAPAAAPSPLWVMLISGVLLMIGVFLMTVLVGVVWKYTSTKKK